ncbi:Uncharacterised protein [uncultured Clostridium sp.]|nr:Uncharacterised protein [uncultured Clostridium sp.]
MEIDFTTQEVLFIYGYFKKKIQKLDILKSTPNCPIADESINQEIELYSSIVDKLKQAQPNLSNLDSYF